MLWGAALPAAPDADAHVPRVAVAAGSVLVHGAYPPPPADSECVRRERAPLHVRLAGEVEVGRASNGMLFVINEVPFETYLEGIAEVPRRWPRAALEAQVIAARTYALSRMARPTSEGRALGYDLCATDACQVYLGRGISHGAWGERWRAAVEATRGLALLHDGRPADTLYFSTSNGSTVGNEEVFGSDPLPYLRPVVERHDGASPLSRWDSRIPLADVTRFLRSSGDWDGPAITRVEQEGETIRLSGGDREAEVSVAGFRLAMNGRSACLAPERYPPSERSGYRLPQTVPSIWYEARTEGEAVVLEGRGWGHGVGMVQWGAHGKARDDWPAAEILGHYYGGLEPRPVDTPGTIRVLVATGLTEAVIAPAGAITERSARLSGDGPWRIRPGEGDGPLGVSAASHPERRLQASMSGAPARARAGRTATVTIDAPTAVAVTLQLIGDDGAAHAIEPARRSRPEGAVEMAFDVPQGLEGGRYRLRAQVTNGIDTVVLDAKRQTRVSRPPGAPSPSPSPSPTAAPPRADERPAAGSRAAGWIAAAAAAAGLAALTATLLTLRRRRARRH